MTIEELQELKEQILETKKENREAKYRMARYALSSYAKCLVTFGPFSPITKDCLNVIREYLNSHEQFGY